MRGARGTTCLDQGRQRVARITSLGPVVCELGGGPRTATRPRAQAAPRRVSARRRCRPIRSAGSRSSRTASASSAWRKRYRRPSGVGSNTCCCTASARAAVVTPCADRDDRLEERRVHVPADHSGAAEDLQRRVRESRQAGRQEVPERRREREPSQAPAPPAPRHRTGSRPPAPRSAQGSRVATRGTGDRLELSRDILRDEGLEPEVGEAAGVLELHENRPQRMAAMELVRPVRADQEDPGVAETRRNEREQLQRRSVRPVQVVNDRARDRRRPRLRRPPPGTQGTCWTVCRASLGSLPLPARSARIPREPPSRRRPGWRGRRPGRGSAGMGGSLLPARSTFPG